MHSAEKLRIGRAAAELVEPGHVIFLGVGGTNSQAMARALVEQAACHVVTASISVAQILGQTGRHDVQLTGGTYSAKHDALRGPAVFDALTDRFFDICFFSVHAIDADRGILDGAEFQHRIQRFLVTRARRYVALADNSKFGRQANFATLALQDVDVIVTDRAPAPHFVDQFEASGTELLIAPRAGERGNDETS